MGRWNVLVWGFCGNVKRLTVKDRGGGEGREMVDGARKKLLVIKNIQGNNMILFLQPFVLIDNTFYLMTTLPFIDFFSGDFFH